MAIHEPGRRLMHHVPLRFVRKRVEGGGGHSVSAALNLTSMIDFLVTIVVFLLMTFSASGEIPVDKSVKLPKAENTMDMLDAPMVAINGRQILVDGHPAGSTGAIEDQGKMQRIDELGAFLKTRREQWKTLNPGKSSKDFPGVCVLQVHETVSALVVKSVFQTAALSGYPNVSFMVGQIPKVEHH